MSMNRSSLFSEHDIVFIHSNGLIYISLFTTLLSLSVNTNNNISEMFPGRHKKSASWCITEMHRNNTQSTMQEDLSNLLNFHATKKLNTINNLHFTPLLYCSLRIPGTFLMSVLRLLLFQVLCYILPLFHQSIINLVYKDHTSSKSGGWLFLETS